MHPIVFDIAMAWHLVLIFVIAVLALRSRTIVDRALALEGLSLLFTAALVVVGIHRESVEYFDIALVIAMLGFVQTVATARLGRERRE